MATKTTVRTLDDLDGSDATETVAFALDGVTYGIDLSEENCQRLRDVFADYIPNARRVNGPRGRRQHARQKKEKRGRVVGRLIDHDGEETPILDFSQKAAPAAARRPDLRAIRAWAQKNGYSLGDRGRIPGAIVAAYDEAQAKALALAADKKVDTTKPGKRGKRRAPQRSMFSGK